MALEAFGRYKLTRRIGKGGMAEVFHARYSPTPGFTKTVVVKRMLAHLTENQMFVNMFQDEAAVSALLSHPNIVQVFDFGEIDGTYYLAMEYVRGANLRQLISRLRVDQKPLDLDVTLYITLEIARGLSYAHRATNPEGKPLKIIHRDLNPPNVLLSVHGDVKIADFGIAKTTQQIQKTIAGNFKGKVRYSAPEILLQEPPDPRADMWGLGCCLYEMLTNRHPFCESGTDEAHKVRAILYDEPPPVADYRGEVPEPVIRVLSALLQKDPNKRPDSAEEIVTALSALVAPNARAKLTEQLHTEFPEIATDGTPSDRPTGSSQTHTQLSKRPGWEEHASSTRVSAVKTENPGTAESPRDEPTALLLRDALDGAEDSVVEISAEHTDKDVDTSPHLELTPPADKPESDKPTATLEPVESRDPAWARAERKGPEGDRPTVLRDELEETDAGGMAPAGGVVPGAILDETDVGPTPDAGLPESKGSTPRLRARHVVAAVAAGAMALAAGMATARTTSFFGPVRYEPLLASAFRDAPEAPTETPDEIALVDATPSAVATTSSAAAASPLSNATPEVEASPQPTVVLATGVVALRTDLKTQIVVNGAPATEAAWVHKVRLPEGERTIELVTLDGKRCSVQVNVLANDWTGRRVGADACAN